MKIFALAVGTFLITNVALAETTTFACYEDNYRRSTVTLVFEDQKMQWAQVTYTGIKGAQTILFSNRDSEVSYGTNSTAKNVYYTNNLKIGALKASLSYPVEAGRNKLSSEESLLGSRYGKLQFSVTAPMEDPSHVLARTFFYVCEIKQ